MRVRKLHVLCFLLLLSNSAFPQDPDFHIYLCFGQSNMAGAGTIEAQDKTVDSRFQVMEPMDCGNLGRSSGKWYPAVPPLWGCYGGLGPADYFGRTMVQNLPSNIKVGVVVVAVPGCDIALFGTTGYQGYDTYNQVPAKYNGSAYAWLLELAKLAQKDGVIKGFLLHQGETNNGQGTWPQKVKGVYDNLLRDLGLQASQTPLLVGELLYQNQGGVCWGHNRIIDTIPRVIPNAHVISAEGLPGKDQFHFNSEGNRLFGARYAQKMLSLLPSGSAPEAHITAPVNNSSYSTIQTINISADALDSDGTVALVEFYDGVTLIARDSTAPYSVNWSGMSSGAHSITARAIDNQGLSGTSAAVTVNIDAAQAPYSESAHQIPGRIEAEEYDLGGEGQAYHEANANGNEGKASFRNDQVDIEVTSDVSGSYNVGYILEGEWLEYTVDVNRTGIYTLSLRMAADGDGKQLHVEMDGVDVSGPVDVPNTGGWQTWATVSVDNVSLIEGRHVMRLAFDASYMNINYIEFGEVTTGLASGAEKAAIPAALQIDGMKIRFRGDFSYRIFSVNGVLLEVGLGKDMQQIGQKLPSGMYVLTVSSGKSVYNGRIVKR